MSALFRSKFSLCTGPLSCVTANFQGSGAKFKHFLSHGGQQFVKKHPPSLCGHSNIARRGENFTKTVALWTPSHGSGSSVYRGRRGFLGKLALGAATGLSIATLVQSLHTGAVSAMALKINLNTAEGDWKKIKGEAVKQNLKECLVGWLKWNTPVESHDQNTCYPKPFKYISNFQQTRYTQST